MNWSFTTLLSGAMATAIGSVFVSCGSDSVGSGPYCGTATTYPEGATGVRTIPVDLVLSGPAGDFVPTTEFEKCGGAAELLVLRVTAPWCGTCEWHATEYVNEVPADTRAKVRLVDVLVGDRNNEVPTLQSATEWSNAAAGVDRTVVDPTWRVAREFAAGIQLPAYVVVDPRTMSVVAARGNPSPAQLRTMLATELAAAHGEAPPAEERDTLYDGLFTREESEMIRAASSATRPPPDPSNRFAEIPAASSLGRAFFMEKGWSANGSVSCQSCHFQTSGCADSLPLSRGIGSTTRNAPTLLMSAHNSWFFADGRADSAWMQALGPIEEPNEFGSSRLKVVHFVATQYADQYARAVGEPLPDFSDLARFPAEGRPGDPAFDSMTTNDQESVNRVFANVGKLIASYERTILVSTSPFDRYVGGELQALTADQKTGLKEFFTLGCAQCHHGPTLSDGAFHALRFPTGNPDGQPDHGRRAAYDVLTQSPFSRSGPFSDQRSAPYPRPADNEHAEGAFRTPTIRVVATTGPYGHGGNIATLDALVEMYRLPGLPGDDARATGTVEPWVPAFGAAEGTHLTKFLATFSGGAQWW